MKVTGLLLAQLGSPDAPTASALRPYLRQFLSDMRVVDYHPLIWQPILHGVILRIRPARSAKLYARIWTDEGSPLIAITRRQVAGLQARLGDSFRVLMGMSYGQPSMRAAFDALAAEGIDRVLVLPLYPQFSSTTTASVYDAVYQAAAGRRCPWFHERKRNVPTLRFVPPYFEEPGFIEAQAGLIEGEMAARGKRPDLLLFSFHGIPQRYADQGDPYPTQCAHTAKLLADRLGLDASQWRIGYQSRFGPEPWLLPNTQDLLDDLARTGKSVLVSFPGFTADCLETLEELGHSGREAWEAAGGEPAHYQVSACLNDDSPWLDFLAELARRERAGW